MSKPNWKAEVAPELAPLLKQMPNITFGPVTSRLVRLVERFLPTPGIPAEIEHRAVRVGERDVELYVPTGATRPRGAVLWIHGGGRIIGTPEFAVGTCVRLAEQGLIVAATSYRKAPKHPFPAALDDCHATWNWLVDNAEELGAPSQQLFVGGESAGGGLAAELTQRLVDEGGVKPVGQLLVYPMLDDRTAARDELTAQKHLVWNNDSNRYGWSAYLGQPAGSPDVPEYAAAARREDLSGLPPSWITVGTLDLFHDEDVEYAERLRDAGVVVDLHVVPGAFHGFFGIGRDQPQIVELWKSIDLFVEESLRQN